MRQKEINYKRGGAVMAPEIIILIISALVLGGMALTGLVLVGGAWVLRQQVATQDAQAGSRVQDYGLGARSGLGVGAPGAPDFAESEWVLRDREGRLVGVQRQSQRVGRPDGAAPANAPQPGGNGGAPAPAPADPNP